MSPVTLNQVYELAQQLTSEDRELLVERLQESPALFLVPHPVTRESLLAEFERRKAQGLFKNQESLFGKYANPNVDISEADMESALREIRDQWKEDMEELDDASSEN